MALIIDWVQSSFSRSLRSLSCQIILFLLFSGSLSTSQVKAFHQILASDTLTNQTEIIQDTTSEDDEEIPESEVVAQPFTKLKDSVLNEDNGAIDRHKVLTEIMSLMGKPYRKKGNGKKGFDCSGFTSRIYDETVGVPIPRSSKEQYKVGQPIDRDSLKFGDLVFFKTRRRIPSHVGIYVGDGLFAHASLSIGVTVSLLDSKYYKRRYVGARRVVE